jgi:hypothetical protein
MNFNTHFLELQFLDWYGNVKLLKSKLSFPFKGMQKYYFIYMQNAFCVRTLVKHSLTNY